MYRVILLVRDSNDSVTEYPTNYTYSDIDINIAFDDMPIIEEMMSRRFFGQKVSCYLQEEQD